MAASVLRSLVLSILLFGVGNIHLYAADEIYTGHFSSQAVGGYDVVSYFTDNKPVKGNKKLSTTYKNAKWLFSSRENLELFKSSPEKYAPQFGGYCAWAIAQGYTAKGDPLHWEIHKEKLYLNYNASIQNKWSRDKTRLIPKAEQNWPQVVAGQ